MNYIRTCSSVDRAPRFGRGSRGFESLQVHMARLPAPADSKDIMVHHGMVSHNHLDARKCEVCLGLRKEFIDAITNGQLGKTLQKLGLLDAAREAARL